MNIEVSEKEIVVKKKYIKIGNYDIDYDKVSEFLELANDYDYYFYFNKYSDVEIERALFENKIIKLSIAETEHNNEVISGERKLKLAELLDNSPEEKRKAKRNLEYLGVKRYDLGDKFNEFEIELYEKLELFSNKKV